MVDIFSVIIYSLFPVYQWIFKGDYVWLLAILVPFTSLKNMNEFYLNIAFESYLTFTTLVPAICLDSFYVLFICNHGTGSKLIEQSINELDEMWINDSRSKSQQKRKLMNIFIQFQDLNE